MKVFRKRFEQLSTGELYRLLQARVAVFVVEQSCPYQELDDKDLKAVHLWLEEDGVQAYARVLPPGVSYEEASVGRVLTVKRGAGLGQKIMEEALRAAEEEFGPGPIRIGAQLYAKGFYERFGFRQVSEPYPEDGIPHIQMVRD